MFDYKKISKMGLGTVQFGCDYGFSNTKSQEEVNRILNKCRKSRVNFLDTARDYGDSERKIGVYFSKYKARKDFFVATKLKKIDKTTTTDRKKLKERVIVSVEKSLEALKIKKIDLLQLHQTDEFLLTNEGLWSIVDNLKKDKIISSFGISVYDVDILRKLIESKGEHIDYVQLPYSIFDRRFESLLFYVRSCDIKIISRSVFLKGIILAKNKDIPDELEGLRMYKNRLTQIAEKYGFSVSELCLLFAISNSQIMTTIIGVNTPAELQENIGVSSKINIFKDKVSKEIREIKVEDRFLIDPRRWKSL